MYRLAQFISIVLSPLTLLPLLLWFAIQRSELDSTRFWQVIVIVFGIGVIVPVVGLVYFKFSGRVSDWGIPVRSQRHQMSLVTLVCMGITWLFLTAIRVELVARIIMFLLGGGILLALITLWWKISAHMVAVTLISLLVTHWFVIDWWWSLPFIISVGWSRIYLNKHTLAQVVGGFGLALSIFFWAKLHGKI